MTERHAALDRAIDPDKETKEADKLRIDLAVQNGEIAQAPIPEQTEFSDALRKVVGDIREQRQRMGDDIDFEAQFRSKLSSLAVPGALELSLLPLSHLGKEAAFVPIVTGPEVAAHVERFLQQELKLDQKTTKNVMKPATVLWRKSGGDELLTALPVTEQASPWLQQIMQDNSGIQGAHVGLALLKKNGEMQIGLTVSLEAPKTSQAGQLTEGAIRDSQGARALSTLGEAVGPLIGVAQNISETLQIVYLGATAKRKGLTDSSFGLHALASLHRFFAYASALGVSMSYLAALQTGASVNLSTLDRYFCAVFATTLLSSLYERGRKKWQSSSAKKIEDAKKKE